MYETKYAILFARCNEFDSEDFEYSWLESKGYWTNKSTKAKLFDKIEDAGDLAQDELKQIGVSVVEIRLLSSVK